MPRVSDAGDQAGVFQVPGVYAALLEREREKTNDGDPRRVYASDGCYTMAPTRLFRALSAGEPVEVPSWRLGGWTVPDSRIRRLKREDRTITSWVVNPDDSVIPVRGEGRS